MNTELLTVETKKITFRNWKECTDLIQHPFNLARFWEIHWNSLSDWEKYCLLQECFQGNLILEYSKEFYKQADFIAGKVAESVKGQLVLKILERDYITKFTNFNFLLEDDLILGCFGILNAEPGGGCEIVIKPLTDKDKRKIFRYWEKTYKESLKKQGYEYCFIKLCKAKDKKLTNKVNRFLKRNNRQVWQAMGIAGCACVNGKTEWVQVFRFRLKKGS